MGILKRLIGGEKTKASDLVINKNVNKISEIFGYDTMEEIKSQVNSAANKYNTELARVSSIAMMFNNIDKKYSNVIVYTIQTVKDRNVVDFISFLEYVRELDNQESMDIVSLLEAVTKHEKEVKKQDES